MEMQVNGVFLISLVAGGVGGGSRVAFIVTPSLHLY